MIYPLPFLPLSLLQWTYHTVTSVIGLTTHFTLSIVTASTVTVTMPDPPYKNPNGSTGKSHQLSTINTSEHNNQPTNKRTNKQQLPQQPSNSYSPPNVSPQSLTLHDLQVRPQATRGLVRVLLALIGHVPWPRQRPQCAPQVPVEENGRSPERLGRLLVLRDWEGHRSGRRL